MRVLILTEACTTMRLTPTKKICLSFFLFFALATLFACSLPAQTIHVDTTATHSIPFDPDLALGTSMDILQAGHFDAVYSDANLKEALSAGWGPITYRLNTELTIAAWHWNPTGTWSDSAHQSGYFTGSSDLAAPLRQSFGYSLPHRGSTRSDASNDKFSRLTDGDPATYWKSNPYLTRKFTGEDDSLHPQWIVIEFDTAEDITTLKIAWANPYATKYVVQYWDGADPFERPTAGTWIAYPNGAITNNQGGLATLKLSPTPIKTRFLRILMSESSSTCDTHGPADPRNCVGYAVNELYAGNLNSRGEFIDLITHTPGQSQTSTMVSSHDPWHTAADIEPNRIQTGFDLFYTSGITNHLPAMIATGLLYVTPEDSAAQLAYIKKRGYPISYVEIGEEPDGKKTMPEDYAALYVQWATALHRIDPKLKLGGPIFEGFNEDLLVWPDSRGRTSWLVRFVDYLKEHNRLDDLAFVSYEHYPFPPCEGSWSDLYREPELVAHILKTFRADGVPPNVPLMISESNLSWGLTAQMTENFAALWLADNAGSFLVNGGAVFYHSPIQPEPLRPGCHGYSTYGNFVANEKLEIRQHTSQYFASQLINLEWIKHGAGMHQLAPATSDVTDEAGHTLITAYAAKRPDGDWSLMLINKDPSNAHEVKIDLGNDSEKSPHHFAAQLTMITFGADQYVWRPAGARSKADPGGPPAKSTPTANPDGRVTLPRASVTILRGKLDR
jgi:F5/8 type C domain